MLNPLSQDSEQLNAYFMGEAFKQAKLAAEDDEVPVGAVIVYQDRIIAKAHNQVETLKDPSAHAEMIAITQAASQLSSKWLHECSLYVTLEPCSMCAGALVLSRIKRIFYAAADPKAGACGSVLNIVSHDKLNHKVIATGGVLEEPCAKILSEFFQKKRKTGKIY